MPGKRDDDDVSSEEDEHASGSGLVDIKLPQNPLAPPSPDSIPLTDMIPSKKEGHGASETKSDEPGSVECLWCEERFDSYKLARKHILLNHGQWEEGFKPHGPDDPIYEDDTFCGEISNPHTPGPPNMTSVVPKTWFASCYDMNRSEEDELHFDDRICFYGLPDHFIPDEYGSDWDEDAEENDKDVPDTLPVVQISEVRKFLDPPSYHDPPGWVDSRLRMK